MGIQFYHPDGISVYHCSGISVYHCTRNSAYHFQLIAEGDKVMTRITMQGIHKGELGGIVPTDKTLTISGFTVFRLVDGKIVEEWEILDELGMMQQLGMELKPKEEKK